MLEVASSFTFLEGNVPRMDGDIAHVTLFIYFVMPVEDTMPET
jgi:hypothetical protein